MRLFFVAVAPVERDRAKELGDGDEIPAVGRERRDAASGSGATARHPS